MLKLTVAVVAIALAGTASAAGWRSMRIDASSEAKFMTSVETLKDKLTRSRRYAFEHVLQHIWLQETQAAAAEQREYTRDDYLRQLDGLTYDEVGRVLDPAGELAQRYRSQYYYTRAMGGGGGGDAWSESPWPTRPPPPVENGQYRGRPQPNQQQ